MTVNLIFFFLEQLSTVTVIVINGDCGVSILGDIKNLSGYDPVERTLGGPA